MRNTRTATRREFLQQAGCTAAALALASAPSRAAAPEARPNILFCMADDWGWPHAPLYGDRVVKTPAFERIAAGGILFNNAFVAAPSCTPSRNAVLTGQHPWRLGAGACLHSQFPEGPVTYPNLLEDHGYFVGHYRKAFGPGRDRPRPVAGRRFDSVDAFFKARPAGKPFCFWFGSSDPHRDYAWQSGLKSGMKLEDVQVPPGLPDAPAVRTDICDYYFEVQRFDREVGELLDRIRAMGELDRTLVFMTGDNGWPFPRGKATLYDPGTHAPLAVMWGDRIPKGRVVDDFVSFVDFAPTILEAAGLAPLEAMTGRSLMPLLTSKQGGQVDPARDHVITGKERHTRAQREHPGGTPMRALRTRAFLYIHNFAPDRWPAGDPAGSLHGAALSDIDAGPTKRYLVEHRDDPAVRPLYDLACAKRPADELYDLAKDPHQLDNVAGRPDYADTVKKFRAQLMAELKAIGDPRATGGGREFDEAP